MAKISSVSLQYGDRMRKFEVHYSAKESGFFVRLPDEVDGIAPLKYCETEKLAVAHAQERLSEFVKLNQTKRRVLLVRAREPGGMRYNSMAVDPAGIYFAYSVCDEVTLPDGERQVIDPQGRRQYVGADGGFSLIEWTEEREAKCKAFYEQLERFSANLARFMHDAQITPAMMDAGPLLLYPA